MPTSAKSAGPTAFPTVWDHRDHRQSDERFLWRKVLIFADNSRAQHSRFVGYQSFGINYSCSSGVHAERVTAESHYSSMAAVVP